MITIENTGNLVNVAVLGDFTLADFREFELQVLHDIGFQGRVNLLLDLRDMVNYTLDVAWEELRFTREHAREFGRVAVVTSDQWVTWSAWLTRLLAGAGIEVFSDYEDAEDWVRGGLVFTTLVSTSELEAHLDDPDWVVFDCRHELSNPGRGERHYTDSHVPGARFLHLDRDLSIPPNGRNGRHPLPEPEAFARRMGELGVGPATQVLAYDDFGGVYASRLWWMLRWLGHDAVAVLDGGWTAWLKEDRPETSELPHVTPARFEARPRNLAVDLSYVEAHLQRPEMCLLDARSAERFRGIGETLDPVGGHIPGARNRYFRDNLGADGRFKPAAQLRAEFEALLKDAPVSAVVHSCGSGVSACHNLLAMEVAGLAGSRLYPGSWSEWCADRRRPIATD